MVKALKAVQKASFEYVQNPLGGGVFLGERGRVEMFK